MIRIYRKGLRHVLSQYFTSTEFDCHCDRPECTQTPVDDRLIELLTRLRLAAGPLAVNSGFRCRAHNAEEGGAPDSFHVTGQAADVRSLEGLTGDHLASIAEKDTQIRENGIGTYSNRIHIDSRGYAARWDG